MDALWNFYEENRDHYLKLSPEDLEDLHSILLSATRDIAEFCSARGLELYLLGGSMLGAIRHQGIIPWDDDVDLTMPRESFEVFIREFGSYKPEKYFVVAPGTDRPGVSAYAKVKVKGTVLEEVIGDRENPEAFVDIFPLDYVSENSLSRHLFSFWSEALRNMNYVTFMALSWKTVIRPMLKNCDFSTRLMMRLGCFAGSILGVIPLRVWNNLLNRTVQRRRTSLMTIPTGLRGYLGEMWPESYWRETIDVNFGGIPMKVSAHYDEMLTRLYGDYMTPPPPEKRNGHYFRRIKLKG